jgi:hypothetical protein
MINVLARPSLWTESIPTDGRILATTEIKEEAEVVAGVVAEVAEEVEMIWEAGKIEERAMADGISSARLIREPSRVVQRIRMRREQVKLLWNRKGGRLPLNESILCSQAKHIGYPTSKS